MRTRVLLIGETGFLGSRVASFLADDARMDVTSLINKTNPVMLHPHFSYKSVYDFLYDDRSYCYDIILNLATRYHGPQSKVEEIFYTNVEIPMLILSKLDQTYETIFLTGDTFFSKFKQKTKSCPYTQSKLSLAEKVSETFSQVKLVKAHIEHMYGAKDSNSKFIPKIIELLRKGRSIDLTECKHKRDFIYVDDVAAAIFHLIKWNYASFNKVNGIEIGTGQTATFKTLIIMAHSLLQSKSTLNFGAIKNEEDFIPISVAKKSRFLDGWNAKINLQSGLEKCIQ